jgi:hypothetical protein
MKNVLRFDKYPEFLALSQAQHLLQKGMYEVLVHEKPAGIFFRILFDNGKLTFGSATRKVNKNNPKYTECFKILERVGLERFGHTPLPKYLVYGYFIGVGQHANLYNQKAFVVTDIKNHNGKFLAYDQMANLCTMIGHMPVPPLYREAYSPARIEFATKNGMLTSNRVLTGAILKTDPMSTIVLDDGTQQPLVIDMSRDVNIGDISHMEEVISDFINTVRELPMTPSILRNINSNLQPGMSYDNWKAIASTKFMEEIRDKAEDIFFVYGERILNLRDMHAKTSDQIYQILLDGLKTHFDTVAKPYYDDYRKKGADNNAKQQITEDKA